MKILWVSQTLLTTSESGTIGHTSRVEMPRQVARLGHTVKVISGASVRDILRKVELVPQVDAVYLPMVNLPFLTTLSFQGTLMFLLPLVLLRFRPDVVIVDHFSGLTAIPYIFLKHLSLLKCNFVLDIRTLPVDTYGWRGWITNQRFDLVGTFAGRFMDGITVITPQMKDELIKRLGLAHNKMGVWESGVNIELFQSAQEQREDLGWADKFVIMYHGTLSPNRGLQEAIKAIRQLGDKYPDVCLCLLGAGKARQELEAIIHQMGLEENVWLYPPVPYKEVVKYVASADVGIIPLPDIEWWATSSPLKLMEYLAAGKPVIVSRIAAHTSVLDNSPCAYYLPTVSADAIANGIRFFYARRDQLKTLGNSGPELVEQRYSWARQAQRLTNYLLQHIATEP